MKFSCIMDAYAWVAYFKGEAGADTAERYIKQKDTATPTIVVAELAAKLYAESPKNVDEALLFVRANSTIIELSFGVAASAGKTRQVLRKQADKNVSLADAIIYETAKELGTQVLTGDPHFKGLENVIYLNEQKV